MVDLDIINGTIAEWESKPLTFVVVERLAWLYIVKDHAIMTAGEKIDKQPAVMPSVALSSGSEFMNACENCDPAKMWSVLDELMEAVMMLQPRLYNATIEKLKE